jgi:hypothetical protein
LAGGVQRPGENKSWLLLNLEKSKLKKSSLLSRDDKVGGWTLITFSIL